jgi:cellulose synthase/poly-beta-1,6-N-acetylglucosamine synthase-like glycosyltransferase
LTARLVRGKGDLLFGLELISFGVLQELKNLFVPSGRYKYFLEHVRANHVLDSFDILILVPYFAILIILAIFGFHRYHLVYLYLKNKKKARPHGRLEELPRVTIQLPVYNEMYVVERLIDSVTAIDYPKELLEIQVLDDSTDETQHIAQKKVESFCKAGWDVHYIHRDHRIGFKAGALEEGLKVSKGEYIAIFDADFIPDPDFLNKTIHCFADPKVGMVQARWGHINRDYSHLTQVEAMILDGHFVMEHGGRYRSGRFFNFNGTAGIWRRQTIEDSGGWEHDTLTEDTDLSYRAQMKGWQFIYLPDVVCPAELPVEMNAFKSQQFRWAKGLVQTGMKLLPRILRSRLPWSIKTEAVFHLTANCSYPLMVLFCFIFLPAMIVRFYQGWFQMLYIDLPLFMAATMSVSSFYMISQKELYPRTWWKSFRYLPFMMSVGIGLSVSNSRAVLEALFGIKTSFKRTPKYCIRSSQDMNLAKTKYRGKSGYTPYFELVLGLYFALTVLYAFSNENYPTLPFLLLFVVGFIYTGLMSLFQSKLHRFSKAKATD